MFRRTFIATVAENGALKLTRPQDFREHLKTLVGREVEITAERRRKVRSQNQNAYYWAVVVKTCADSIGYTPEEMHEAFKFLFLRRRIEGKPETVRSTASLSVAEFIDYVEQCRVWAADEGIRIPDPREINIELEGNVE